MRGIINTTSAAIAIIGITLRPPEHHNKFQIQKGEPGGSPFCSFAESVPKRYKFRAHFESTAHRVCGVISFCSALSPVELSYAFLRSFVSLQVRSYAHARSIASE
jgi:hypothetical protein